MTAEACTFGCRVAAGGGLSIGASVVGSVSDGAQHTPREACSYFERHVAIMTKVLGELVQLLALERIEENLFRGQSQNPRQWGRLYGGQVLGQALSAAAQTVPKEREVHSLQAYFMRPGDVSRPVVYEVDRIREGGSFTTRRVVAIQGGQAFHLQPRGVVPDGRAGARA